jgi:dynein heavy chain
MLEPLFLFALVWGVGGAINGDSRTKFDEFLRQLLAGTVEGHVKPKSLKFAKNTVFPERGLVFDFFFKTDTQAWALWSDAIESGSLPANASPTTVIVPTIETVRQGFFFDLYLTHNVPVLFVGPTGTGKSAIVNDRILKLPKEKYLPNTITFSARTTASQTQDIIFSKLDRRRKGVYGPPMGKKCVVFVDDLNMPQKEKYGAQPPIELLRQFCDHKHWCVLMYI